MENEIGNGLDAVHMQQTTQCMNNASRRIFTAFGSDDHFDRLIIIIIFHLYFIGCAKCENGNGRQVRERYHITVDTRSGRQPDRQTENNTMCCTHVTNNNNYNFLLLEISSTRLICNLLFRRTSALHLHFLLES